MAADMAVEVIRNHTDTSGGGWKGDHRDGEGKALGAGVGLGLAWSQVGRGGTAVVGNSALLAPTDGQASPRKKNLAIPAVCWTAEYCANSRRMR